MLISIIIRCKDEGMAIGGTLSRIYMQETVLSYEVVIVDSGSTDHTVEIADAYPAKVYQIPSELFSYGYALNYGIQRACGNIIVNLSAHCLPKDTLWLAKLVGPIVAGEADATYGRQTSLEGMNPFEEVSLLKHFPAERKITGRVPFSNANCAFRRTLWDEQPFDEKLPSWEDYLWYRLLKDQYIFQYSPDATVFHSHRFSLRALATRAYKDGMAFRMMKEKHGLDLLNETLPAFKDKVSMVMNDILQYVMVFKDRGYGLYIPLIPVVRFLAYCSYWRGYRTVM